MMKWQIGEQEEEAYGDRWEIEWETPLQTDRPDFGAATTAVGRGRAVLETGYTLFHDRSQGELFTGHSYPDAVLRIGMFTDWFEFRIGQTFSNFKTTPGVAGVPTREDGAQDLYLCVKFALTEQKGCLPETAMMLQSLVPTGSDELTAGQMLPAVTYLFGWDFGETRWGLSGFFEAARLPDDSDHYYVQVAQGMNLRYQCTRRFAIFTEWVGLYPASAIDPGIGPQHYIHPGVLYLVSNNIQLDAHVFIGINEHAIDFFGGPGLSLRF